MRETRISWRCGECQGEISDGTGYLDYDAYGDGGFMGWRVVHRRCDALSDADTYWWRVERLRTHDEIGDAVAHMRTRRWWDEHAWTTLWAAVQ